MINLHINENLKNFIYDLNNYIAIYDNSLYVFNYQDLMHISKTNIILRFNNYKIEIEGINFKINKMTKQELKIVGKINNMRFIYEEN